MSTTKVMTVYVDYREFNIPFENQQASLSEVAETIYHPKGKDGLPTGDFNEINKLTFTCLDGSVVLLNESAIKRSIFVFREI